MENIYKNRLLLLADFMEQLPPEKFDFSHFVNPKFKGEELNISCNTTACSLGWATSIPELKEAGLVLYRVKNYAYVVLSNRIEYFEKFLLNENFLNYFSETELACKKVFDLTEEETEYLFCPLEDHCETEYEDEDPIREDMNEIAIKYDKPSPIYRCSVKEMVEHIRFFVSKKYPN